MMTPSRWFTIDPDYLNRLHRQAVHWLHHGVNVLPFWGDMNPTAPKKPALKEEYRDRLYTQRTTDADIDQWFGATGDGFAALGIITGGISGIAVLDPDRPELAAQFAADLPALTDTYSELSAGRGLPHYFYRLPNGASYQSRGRAGVVEWLADGRRCIVAPTQIDGRTYQRQPGNIRTLTLAEFEQIKSWLNVYAPAPPPLEAISTTVKIGAPGWIADELMTTLSEQETDGRNHALFRTAIKLRKVGVGIDTAIAELIPTFIELPAPPGHKREGEQQRRREGMATILSAYRSPEDEKENVMYGSLREKLVQAKDVLTARAYDLITLRWQPGTRVSQAAVRNFLQENGMSKKSAVKVVPEIARRAQQEPVIRIDDGSGTGSKHPDTERGGATACPLTSTANFRLVPKTRGGAGGMEEGVKNASSNTLWEPIEKGRGKINPKARLGTGETMVIPSAETLCMAYDVTPRGRYRLPVDAMRSNKLYLDAIEANYNLRVEYDTVRQAMKRLGMKATSTRNRLKRVAVGKAQDPRRELIAPGDITRLADVDGLIERGCYLEIDGSGAKVDMGNVRAAWLSGREVVLITPMPTRYYSPHKLGVVKPSETAQNRASKPAVQHNRAAGTDYQPPAETPLYAAVSLASDEISAAVLDDPLLQLATALGAVVIGGHRTAPELVELPADDEIRKAG